MLSSVYNSCSRNLPLHVPRKFKWLWLSCCTWLVKVMRHHTQTRAILSKLQPTLYYKYIFFENLTWGSHGKTQTHKLLIGKGTAQLFHSYDPTSNTQLLAEHLLTQLILPTQVTLPHFPCSSSNFCKMGTKLRLKKKKNMGMMQHCTELFLCGSFFKQWLLFPLLLLARCKKQQKTLIAYLAAMQYNIKEMTVFAVLFIEQQETRTQFH